MPSTSHWSMSVTSGASRGTIAITLRSWSAPLRVAGKPREDPRGVRVHLQQLRRDAVDPRQALDHLVVVAVAASPPHVVTAELGRDRELEQAGGPQLGEGLGGEARRVVE